MSPEPSVKVVGRARDRDGMLELVDELAPEPLIISIRTALITTMATRLDVYERSIGRWGSCSSPTGRWIRPRASA